MLAWLTSRPAFLLPVLVVVLLVAGLTAPPAVGVPLLAVLGLLLLWLSYLSWPALDGGGRAVRAAVVVLVLVAAVRRVLA